MRQYLSLIPEIIKRFLNRVEGVKVEDPSDYPSLMSKLGVESDLVAIAASLLTSNFEDKNIPNFEELTRVVEGIAYYFIPPSLQSSTNPMCGMRDVLQNAKFQDQVKGTILELEQKIEKLKGKEVMGKIEAALDGKP